MSLPPARLGDPVEAIDTPALIVDHAAMARNIARMAREAADAGISLRPHAKTHKCAAVARAQVAAGAIGVACQKTAEAEAMVAGGIADVLVTNQVVAPAKLTRLAALARVARIGLCLDAAGPARAASAAAVAAGSTLDVLVEVDVGQGRCGTAPGAPAAELAALAAGLPGLRFRGLQAYNGAAQHLRSPAERAAAVARSADATRATLDALADRGLEAPVVGGAGTGTYTLETPGPWTEIQPGSYVFMDADYARNGLAAGVAPYEQALWVLATVISRRDLADGRQHLVLDAGHKAAAIDSGPPRLADHPTAEVAQMSDEHAVAILAPDVAAVALGERLRLVPGHIDPTVNLHDHLVVLAETAGARTVVSTWPIEARGAVR